MTAAWRPGKAPPTRAPFGAWLQPRFGRFEGSLRSGSTLHLVAAVRAGAAGNPQLVTAFSGSLGPEAKTLGADRELPEHSAELFVDERSACAITTASDRRVVCASDAETVQQLLPLALDSMRTLTNSERVWVHLRPAAVARTYGQRLRGYAWASLLAVLGVESRNRQFDAAFEQVLAEVTEEGLTLASELESVVLALGEDPAGRGDASRLTMDATLSGNRSIVGGWVGGADRAPLPAFFWKFPESTEAVHFSRGTPTDLLLPVKNVAAELLGGLLAYQGTPRRLQNEAANLVRALPLPRSAFAYARGPLSKPSPSDPHDLDQRGEEELAEAIGWHLLTLQDPADRYKSFVHQLLRTYADPVLGPQLGRVLRSQGAAWGIVALTERRRAPGFPKGSLVVDAILPHRAFDPRQQRYEITREEGLKLTLAVVPNGTLTHIAVAASDAVLKQILRPNAGAAAAAAGPASDLLRKDALLAAGLIADAPLGSEPGLEYAVTADEARRRLTLEATLEQRLLLELWPEYENLLLNEKRE